MQSTQQGPLYGDCRLVTLVLLNAAGWTNRQACRQAWRRSPIDFRSLQGHSMKEAPPRKIPVLDALRSEHGPRTVVGLQLYGPQLSTLNLLAALRECT